MAIKIVCSNCGSSDVLRDAWASWNTQTQQWELENVFDEAWCDNCAGSTSLIEEPLED